jgi:YspA, cpYpsA-related SLOG family
MPTNRPRPRVVMFAGTRDLPNASTIVKPLIYALPENTIVLHGGNGKVDDAAEFWARERGLVTGVFYPNWLKHGKRGGPLRTLAMVQLLPDEIYVVWNGKSPGSKRAVEFAKEYDRKLIEHLVEGGP